MKKLLLTGLATIALAAGVFAQGSVLIDNSALANGFTTEIPGAYYNGTMGLEVWMANLASVPAGINLAPGPESGVLGYSAMLGDGNFHLEKTYVAFTAAIGGANLGELDMADVTPGGATVVLALAAWNTAAASWNAMLSSANAGTRAGVLAFTQPTADFVHVTPPPTPKDLNWPNGVDLVMTLPVPEPGAFALAGLGAAALLSFRRRK
jgi:MYXO-CTERM domain-containing protein